MNRLWNKEGEQMKRGKTVLGISILAILFSACGVTEPEDTAQITEMDTREKEKDNTQADMEAGNHTVLEEESAADGQVDFDKVQECNPEIFAWLYIPGSGIDAPVLQSAQSDDFYQKHDAMGNESAAGALYTEMPNNMNMCDFNTIIHGYDRKETDLFYGLHCFEEQNFFEENEQLYLYMPGNVLTYEIVAAYYDDGGDILRRYDYTTYAGCDSYLQELFGEKSMTKHIREGWEDLTPNHFLLTLNSAVRNNGTQYIVVAVLVQDAAGVIDRVRYEE